MTCHKLISSMLCLHGPFRISPHDTVGITSGAGKSPPSSPCGGGSASPDIATSSRQTQPLHPTPSPTFYALNLVDYSPVNDSRRRNAENRAEALRADPLIGKAEPNRVFCTMCQKWVQLRQDSSYCAYPWLQHRGKCMARQYVNPKA
jgi:hypothetical protein